MLVGAPALVYGAQALVDKLLKGLVIFVVQALNTDGALSRTAVAAIPLLSCVLGSATFLAMPFPFLASAAAAGSGRDRGDGKAACAAAGAEEDSLGEEGYPAAAAPMVIVTREDGHTHTHAHAHSHGHGGSNGHTHSHGDGVGHGPAASGLGKKQGAAREEAADDHERTPLVR